MVNNKFGKKFKKPDLQMELGTELKCWKMFKIFLKAIIGAGLKDKEEKKGATARRKEQEAFDLELRNMAMLLDSIGDPGMDIFETWELKIEGVQYEV